MLDAILFGCFLLTLGALWCGWRAFSLFARWRSASAVMMASDYPEVERFDDRWGVGALRGWRPLTDGDGRRLIMVEAMFEDGDGKRHRAGVRRYVRAGYAPDAAFLLWYDPADPKRATTFGPGSWLLAALAVALAIVPLVRLGMGLPR